MTREDSALVTELANRIVAGIPRKKLGPRSKSSNAFLSFEEISNWASWAWGYTNWRFQILRNLANLSPQGADEIRLYTPATIDFAYWLDQTDTTPIDLQAEIMRLISALPQPGFGARGIISFDPWSQVKAWKDNAPGPLDWVKNAFAAGGHVGVKIYPARGFLPYFNAGEDYFPRQLWELTAPRHPRCRTRQGVGRALRMVPGGRHTHHGALRVFELYNAEVGRAGIAVWLAQRADTVPETEGKSGALRRTLGPVSRFASPWCRDLDR
jgi:hypothetical protein